MISIMRRTTLKTCFSFRNKNNKWHFCELLQCLAKNQKSQKMFLITLSKELKDEITLLLFRIECALTV